MGHSSQSPAFLLQLRKHSEHVPYRILTLTLILTLISSVIPCDDVMMVPLKQPQRCGTKCCYQRNAKKRIPGSLDIWSELVIRFVSTYLALTDVFPGIGKEGTPFRVRMEDAGNLTSLHKCGINWKDPRRAPQRLKTPWERFMTLLMP